MKITDIKLGKNYPRQIIINDSNVKLAPVTITYKTWYGRQKTLEAFPTTYGPTFGSGKIIYFVFVDSLGKELDDTTCKQINNWLRNQQVVGNL